MKKTLFHFIFRFHFLFLFVLCFSYPRLAFAQKDGYAFKQEVPYYSEAVREKDAYIRERGVLDVYYPKNIKKFATLIWLHGGGLSGGNKLVPEALKNQGLAVVAVNYRLFPKAKAPQYIEDTAAAVAWVFNNIEALGGDSQRIFVAGYSAGGYLTNMVGLDKRWLKVHDIDANRIAGLISFSGQGITHSTVREERGLASTKVVVDELAPLYHVRPDAPPLLLITGGRDLDLPGRYEENAFLARMMTVVGHKQTRLLELQGYSHSVESAAFPLLLKEVERIQNGMEGGKRE